MTASLTEIKDALTSYKGGMGDVIWDLVSTYGNKLESIDFPNVGTVKHVDSKVGAEGGGEDIWFVFSINDDKLYRITGYYTSYDGSYWEGPVTEVTPREITVTVFDDVV